MRKMVRDLKRARLALGDGQKQIHASEQGAYAKMGKAMVAARDLPAGHVLSGHDIAFKSPGVGLPPCDLERLIGRVLLHPVSEDTAFTLAMLDGVPSAQERLVER